MGLLPFLLPRNRAYAHRHGYDYRYLNRMTADLPVYWQKPHLAAQALEAGYDAVVWLDTDAVVHDLDRPLDRLLRGGEALTMLKAWNTGHPGGVATLHANSPADALRRLEELIGEVSQHIPRHTIAAAIGLIIFIERIRRSPWRHCSSVIRVRGLENNSYRFGSP